MEHISLSLLLAVSAYVVYFFAASDLWGPLRKVPGPFLARFTPLWELFALLNKSKPYVYTAKELHEKYGPIVRLAPGRYSITDPEAVKQIYSHSSKFTKGYFYHAFLHTETFDDIFVDRNVGRHSAQRRKMAQLYSTSTLKSYEPFIEDVTAELLERFEGLSRANTIIRLPEWLQFYALDVVGQMTFSSTCGLIKAGGDREDGMLKGFYMTNYIGSIIGIGLPSVQPLAKKIVKFFSGRQALKGVAWIRSKLADHSHNVQKGSSSIRSDFNEKVLDLMAQGKMNAREQFIVVGQNLGAGSDTTGNALGAFCWFMTQHPDALENLREEMRNCKSEGRLSNPVTFAETQAMPYLQACIKEALRCHPGVGLILARDVPKGGMQLGDYFFPEGTVVGSNAWNLNFLKETWGPDADDFRPERWLEGPERAKKFETALFSFGAGSRTCIGKNISLLEMSKLVPQLYRTFDFDLVSDELKLDSGWFVYPKYDVRIRPLDKPI